MANKQALRELQTRLAERMQAARSQPRGQSWLAVECRGHGLLLPLEQAGEIFPLGPLLPVPHTQPWFAGVANLRGGLHGVVDLARFLTSEGAQRAMTEGAALRPTRPDLYRDPALVAHDPSLPTLLGLMEKGHPRPITPYYLMLSSTLQPEFSAVLVGRKSPDRAIRDGGAQVDHLLRAITP